MPTTADKLDALAPLPTSEWDDDAVRHLLRRVGVEPSADDVEYYGGLGLDLAVDTLTHPERVPYNLVAPRWATRDFDDLAEAAYAGDTEPMIDPGSQLAELREWWIQRIWHTRRPLEEKLTLFWHSHFATQADRVRSPRLVYRHNQMLREHAFDFFPVLVTAVARDPAMIRFLDLESSQRDRPNDNFARELMELFTLGEGHYSERDVAEAARAFTGWTVQGERAVFNSLRHDDGEKVFMGQHGRWNGDDIIRIIFEQRRASRFLPEKLFRYFVNPNPDSGLLAAWSDRFDEVFYSTRDWLGELFRSQSFYAAENRHVRVKSPVEYVIGLYRQLEVEQAPAMISALALRRMGQELFQPPDVDGWKEDTHWVNTHTLLMRYHFAYFCATGIVVDGLRDRAAGRLREAQYQPLFSARDWVTPARYRNPEACIEALLQRVLGRSVEPREIIHWSDYLQTASNNARVSFDLERRMPSRRFQDASYLLLCSPEYQVC